MSADCYSIGAYVDRYSLVTLRKNRVLVRAVWCYLLMSMCLLGLRTPVKSLAVLKMNTAVLGMVLVMVPISGTVLFAVTRMADVF